MFLQSSNMLFLEPCIIPLSNKPTDVPSRRHRLRSLPRSPCGGARGLSVRQTTGPALDKGIYIAYVAKYNRVVNTVRQINQTRAALFHLSQVSERLGGHLRNTTKVLNDQYALCVGLCGTIRIPTSHRRSSLVCVGYHYTSLGAPCRLNSVYLALTEMMFLANKAENEYMGVPCVITG